MNGFPPAPEKSGGGGFLPGSPRNGPTPVTTTAAATAVAAASRGGGGSGGMTLRPASPPRKANWQRPTRIVTAAATDETAAAATDGHGGRKRRESPCAGTNTNSGGGGGRMMDSGFQGSGGGGGDGGGGGGGGGVQARGISAFSPYAARMESGNSPEDEVAGAVTRLESLRFGSGDERESLQSPAKKHQTDKGDASAHGVGVARRMQFFQEGSAPDGSSEVAAAVPAVDPRVVSPSPMVTGDGCEEAHFVTDDGPPAAASAGVSMEISSAFGSLHQGGDQCEEPPPVVAKNRTLIVYPTECLLHMGGEDCEGHQEAPKRLELLCGENGALRRQAFRGLEWADPSDIKPAVISDLLRVHEYDYLLHIQERCEGAPSGAPPPPPPPPPSANSGGISPLCSPGGTRYPTRSAMAAAATNASDVETRRGGGVSPSTKSHATVPTVSGSSSSSSKSAANRMTGAFGQRFAPDPGYVDVDTRVSRESYEAARMAAGAVILAVDRVVGGKNQNAFVAVRPPGHHAGPSGSVPSASFWKNPGMNSSGFCLLNNAAIGAAYARCRYGRSGEVTRVAIVDIDIHHGNGTEEIVRCLQPVTTRLPLPPSWPPMTKTVYKPWLDQGDTDNVFFGSVSLQDKDSFYPASGTEEEHFDSNDNIVNVSLSALGPPPGEEGKKRALTKTKLTEYVNKAGSEFKQKCQRTLLARLKDFSPDLLIISAGFDGHVEDYYHYLSNETYHWITTALGECCPSGRVVSVLEGGYSLEARVSRAKAAQQARANTKRTTKPEAVASSSVAGGTAGSGPARRERRTRPATRGSASSASGPSVPMAAKNAPPPPQTAGEALRPGSSSDFMSSPSSSLLGAPSAGVVPMVTSSPEKRPASVPGIVPGAVRGTVPGVASGTVPGTIPGTVPRNFPGAVVHMSTISADTSMNVAVAGELPKPPPSAAAAAAAAARVAVVAPPLAPREARSGSVGHDDGSGGGDGDAIRVRPGSEVAGFTATGTAAAAAPEKPVLRPEDGGLVRGVVSHVTALMQACAGEGFPRSPSVQGAGGKHVGASSRLSGGGGGGMGVGVGAGAVARCVAGKKSGRGGAVRGLLKGEERTAMQV